MSIFGTKTPYVNYDIGQWQWGIADEISCSPKQQETIDFSTYSKDDILNKFKSSEWSNLEEHNRIALLQEMENRFAKADGREPATVKTLDTNYGSYNDTTNTMYIRIDDAVPSYEVLDSFVHEDNHAHQAYGSNKESEYDAFTQKMIDVESARDERGHLYNYESNGPRYGMQCNEMDSNNKAAIALLEESERYKNDSEYHNYIRRRCVHFEELNHNVENLQSDRLNMQQNQIYKAYVNGDLTQNEYESMKNTLYIGEYMDSAARESKQIENQVKEMDSELTLHQGEETGYSENPICIATQYLPDEDFHAVKSHEDNGFDYTGGLYQDSSSTVENVSDESISY